MIVYTPEVLKTKPADSTLLLRKNRLLNLLAGNRDVHVTTRISHVISTRQCRRPSRQNMSKRRHAYGHITTVRMHAYIWTGLHIISIYAHHIHIRVRRQKYFFEPDSQLYFAQICVYGHDSGLAYVHVTMQVPDPPHPFIIHRYTGVKGNIYSLVSEKHYGALLKYGKHSLSMGKHSRNCVFPCFLVFFYTKSHI